MSPPNQKEKMIENKSNINLIKERQKAFMEEIKLPLMKTEQEQPQSAYFATNFYNDVFFFIIENRKKIVNNICFISIIQSFQYDFRIFEFQLEF